MARTTVDDIKAILDDTGLTDLQLGDYLTSANIYVTGNLSDKGLSDDVLTEIERWIAAHMVSITRERPAKEAEAGGARILYTGEWGKGLENTSYGQMAIALDSTGTLKAISDGVKTAWTKAVESFDS